MSGTLLVTVTLLFAQVTACVGSPAKPANAVTATPVQTVPEASDKCTTIPTGCPGSADDDGCPEVALEIGPECAVGDPDAKTLAAIAKEMRNDNRLTRLRIVTSKEGCAGAVVQRLVAEGVSAERFERKIIAGDRFVYFEVAEWDGKPCGMPM